MAPTSIQAHKRQGQWVVLHFQGVAYVTLSPRMPSMQAGAKILGEEMSVLVPMRPVPPIVTSKWPLSGCTSGRSHILPTPPRFRRPGSHIILPGDSTGGHLALSLLRHISDYPKVLNKSFCRRTARLTISGPLLRTRVFKHSYSPSCGEIAVYLAF
jgi:hypothetical protein